MPIATTVSVAGSGLKPWQPRRRELPTELLHMTMDHLQLDDLHKCRLVCKKWNDVATEQLRSFAVLNRSRVQRRWDPEAAKEGEGIQSLWSNLHFPANMYWLSPHHPSRFRRPPLKEVSIGLHHPEDCWHLTTETEDGGKRVLDQNKILDDFKLTRHVPVLKITLQGSPLYENYWRIEDDPEGTPFDNPTQIHGYKTANMHGERLDVPSKQPYTDCARAVRPDDFTAQFTHCGFSDLIGDQVDTIGKLVMYNVPFMYGEGSDAVYESFHHKVEEMVLILTYPGKCKLTTCCNDLGECEDETAGIPDYKAKDLARIIPSGKKHRLKKVAIVFKPKDPSMKWDKGCFHRGRRGAWWAPELLGNLARELAKPEYAGIDFEFVNLDCLSLTPSWKPGRKIEPKIRRPYLPEWLRNNPDLSHYGDEPCPHAELDAAMRLGHFDGMTEHSGVSTEDVSDRQDQLTFTTMQDWVESGDAYGILTAKETFRYKEFWRLGPEKHYYEYPHSHDFFTNEHLFHPEECQKKWGDGDSILDWDTDEPESESGSDGESDFGSDSNSGSESDDVVMEDASHSQ